MATTWTIAIDWDRNVTYTDTYDDVTHRTISANWFSGMRKPYLDYAEDGMLTIELDNSDKRYSPENIASPIYDKVAPFRPVRIQSNDGSTPRTHWVGWIERIEPDVDYLGKRQVSITVAGPMQFFKAAETTIAPTNIPHSHIFPCDDVMRGGVNCPHLPYPEKTDNRPLTTITSRIKCTFVHQIPTISC